MDYLPKDPAILVSSVNMLLRDEEFDTLESLCYAFSREPKEIKDYLMKYGFVWSERQKQFRPIGYDERLEEMTNEASAEGKRACTMPCKEEFDDSQML
jgi:hypothetical protein